MTAVLEPMPIGELVEYEWLSPVDQVLIEAWLLDHNIEPKTTPVHCEIEYDPVHDEFRVEQLWTDADGRPQLMADGETIRTFFVRRRRKSDLPWPTWASKVNELWDRVTDPSND